MTDLLSSDILERQFGPTELEVLQQDDKTRLICTKSASGGQVLELSQVTFRAPGMAGFPDVHRQIVAGTSMGKAFASRGIAFKRHVRATCKYDRQDLPASFSSRFGRPGAPTVIDVSILVGPEQTPYADILEVYSPEVSWPLSYTAITPEIPGRLRALGELLAAT